MRYMMHVGKLLIDVKKYYLNCVVFFRLSNPNISQWMKAMNITNSTGIHSYYANRILDITRNINVTPIVWQDVRDEHVVV